MSTVLLFGMPGGWELVVIVVIVLLLFGAKKIPELARGVGRGIREFKDATKEVNKEVEQAAKPAVNVNPTSPPANSDSEPKPSAQ